MLVGAMGGDTHYCQLARLRNKVNKLFMQQNKQSLCHCPDSEVIGVPSHRIQRRFRGRFRRVSCQMN